MYGTFSALIEIRPRAWRQTLLRQRQQLNDVVGSRQSHSLNIRNALASSAQACVLPSPGTSAPGLPSTNKELPLSPHPRSLRNDNKIVRLQNLHFQNFVVVAFPTKKNSVLGQFPSLLPIPNPPLKIANSIFIVVSPSLTSLKNPYLSRKRRGVHIFTLQGR